jgi:poly(3-hydroxybutyrate) depolymerase
MMVPLKLRFPLFVGGFMRSYRLRCIRVVLSVCLLCVLGSAPIVYGQALPSLASLSVTYSTEKQKVRPTGELAQQIADVDVEIREAQRLGRTGELRRLLAKGMRLLAGGEWTSEFEYSRSLVLRTSRTVVDPRTPWDVRLEQIFASSIALTRPLSARVVVRKPAVPATAGAAAQPPVVVRDLGTRDSVSRDLRESPLALVIDLSGLPDGRYQLVVDTLDDTRTLSQTIQAFEIRQGLDVMVDRLEKAAASAPEALRASILFPVDRMRTVNRGVIPLTSFNPAADFAAAEAVAAAAAAGLDPFATATRQVRRHYLLESAAEVMPYRLYVPTTYVRGTPHPVVVALHGLGGTEAQMLDGYGGELAKVAEQHGVIVASPLGYRSDGWYGWQGSISPNDPEAVRSVQRSEEDVLQVLTQVQQHYTVDTSRVYLMGHSMGAIGTWHLGAKYPDMWAALGPVAGIGDPTTVERMRNLPQFVVHGDADPTVAVTFSRAMVARMRALGMNPTYVEVPGGDHNGVFAPHLAAMFEFFLKHKRPDPTR